MFTSYGAMARHLQAEIMRGVGATTESIEDADALLKRIARAVAVKDSARPCCARQIRDKECPSDCVILAARTNSA